MADQGWEQVAAEAIEELERAVQDDCTSFDHGHGRRTSDVTDARNRLLDVVRQQAAEVARLRAEREQLANALRRLTGEVRACWGMDEPTLRHELGNTNYSAVEDCIAAALAALADGGRGRRTDAERLREAINRIGNLEWIIAPWHAASRVGQEFHWRVNVRDEPSLSKTSQTYTGTSFVGPTPADAALAALTPLAAGEAEGA